MEEIWKDVKGYEGKYQVSNLGNVKSLNYNNTGKPKELKKKINKLGFYEVKFSKNNKTKDFMVAKLVLETFKPTNRLGNVVINIDGNKLNCCLENLKWVYHTEQRHRMYNRGNRKLGKPSRNTLSYHKEGYSNFRELAQAYLMNRKELMQRLERGWDLDTALNVPVDVKNKGKKPYFYEYYGKMKTIYQIAKMNKINPKLIQSRIYKGWNIYEAAEIEKGVF